MSDIIYSWLSSAGLEEYYNSFVSHGITPERFINITIQDYAEIGITQLHHKQKLFRLITNIKREGQQANLDNISNNNNANNNNSGIGNNNSSAMDQNSSVISGNISSNFTDIESYHDTSGMDQNDNDSNVSFGMDQNYNNVDIIANPNGQPMQNGNALPLLVPHGQYIQNNNMNNNNNNNNNNLYGNQNNMNNINNNNNNRMSVGYNQQQIQQQQQQSTCPIRIVEGAPVDDPRGVPTISRTVLPQNELFIAQLRNRIRVVIRKRPMNSRELASGQRDVVTCDGWNQISVHEPKQKVDLTKYVDIHTFRFDQVFSEFSSNDEVYFYTAKPLVNAIFRRKHATCFAYGATGSGKTYTMMEKTSGIYVLAARDIFTFLALPQFASLGLFANVSFFEIYGGKLFDLLNNRQRLHAREDAKGVINIAGLEEKRILSVEELLQSIDYGLNSRSVGATGVNADSSRSHAILQIVLRDQTNNQFGKISFIDLAGSERAADTMNTDKQTHMEGAEINKSLLALKECIRALDKGQGHTPFRQSKLTMVLRDSFVGDARTVMIGNISPNDKSCENTLNSLRYADRVRELQARQTPNNRLLPVLKLNEVAADVVLGRDGSIPDQNNMIQNQYNNSNNSMNSNNMDYINNQNVMNNHNMNPIGMNQNMGNQDKNDMANNNMPMSNNQPGQDNLFALEGKMMENHRKQVEAMMLLVKQEVVLLHSVEQNEISMDNWISKLESILQKKEESIAQLRYSLNEFKQQLRHKGNM